jgi:hypothetical protein
MEGSLKKTRSRVAAPADPSIPMTVDTVLVYGDQRMSFGFSQRCPATRLYENVGKGLGIKVARIVHCSPITGKAEVIPNDGNVWVLEDCGVKNGSIIQVFADDKAPRQEPIYDNMIEMTLQWRGLQREQQPIPYYVRKGTTVGRLIKSIRIQITDVLPDTVRVFYRGEELRNLSDVPDWQAGELITMEGQFFPLSLLPNTHFAQNLNLYPSEECVICYEKLGRNRIIFECGHINVCRECWGQRGREKCPVCRT